MSLNVPVWAAASVVVVTTVAVVSDVRARRIPNRLTGPALLLGLIVHGLVGGWPGLAGALLGMLVAGGLLLPGWVFGWTGAGDVKLMAAVGAWLGLTQGFFAVLVTFMAGGVIAVIVAVRHGALRRVLSGAAGLASWAVTTRGKAPPPPDSGIRFPFALAVFVGAWVSMWVRP